MYLNIKLNKNNKEQIDNLINKWFESAQKQYGCKFIFDIDYKNNKIKINFKEKKLTRRFDLFLKRKISENLFYNSTGINEISDTCNWKTEIGTNNVKSFLKRGNSKEKINNELNARKKSLEIAITSDINKYLINIERNKKGEDQLNDIKSRDPKPILDRLGIEVNSISNGYKLKNNPSCSFTKYKGQWRFKDWNGTINNIDIFEFVMINKNEEKFTFKNALDFINDVYNNTNMEIEENEISYIKKEENKKNAMAGVKIIYIKSTLSDDAINFMNERGIDLTIPRKGLYEIEFERNGKRTRGVGSINGDCDNYKGNNRNITGLDIHVTDYMRKHMKTISAGEKNISIMKISKTPTNIAIFESKMDYFAVDPRLLKKSIVIVANGTGQKDKIIDYIKNQKIKKIMFFNQYDKAGYKFTKDLVEGLNLETFSYVLYDKGTKIGTDINDLVKDKETFFNKKNILDKYQRIQTGNPSDFIKDNSIFIETPPKIKLEKQENPIETLLILKSLGLKINIETLNVFGNNFRYDKKSQKLTIYNLETLNPEYSSKKEINLNLLEKKQSINNLDESYNLNVIGKEKNIFIFNSISESMEFFNKSKKSGIYISVNIINNEKPNYEKNIKVKSLIEKLIENGYKSNVDQKIAKKLNLNINTEDNEILKI
jgi:hypothetical protein